MIAEIEALRMVHLEVEYSVNTAQLKSAFC